MEENKMKYTAPEMEMKELEVEDIHMSGNANEGGAGDDAETPEEQL